MKITINVCLFLDKERKKYIFPFSYAAVVSGYSGRAGMLYVLCLCVYVCATSMNIFWQSWCNRKSLVVFVAKAKCFSYSQIPSLHSCSHIVECICTNNKNNNIYTENNPRPMYLYKQQYVGNNPRPPLQVSCYTVMHAETIYDTWYRRCFSHADIVKCKVNIS